MCDELRRGTLDHIREAASALRSRLPRAVTDHDPAVVDARWRRASLVAPGWISEYRRLYGDTLGGL